METEARALSMRQPWATLIMMGRKGIESRSGNTKRRGRVFIHASATMGPAERAAAIREGLDPDALPRGVILGSAEIVDAAPAEKLQLSQAERALGDYRRGRWGWKLANVETLAQPVACTGALSFWRVPRSVVADIEAQSALVFVYGTLKRGHGNHRLLAAARSVGPDYIEGTMHDLGSFPAISLGGSRVVAGELYRINASTLAALDRLEGTPGFYQRTRVTTARGLIAWVYSMAPTRLTGRPRIDSGVWPT